ncbi:MAG TPA: DUF5131 family protein [Thermoanaerobaculia bacterium]|nr:DUF5131 family protein [Thermoanaerobaculia bacterium]
MATKTRIAWTDDTANFWMGCLKVSPGCANCYAEKLTRDLMGINVWGPPATTPRQIVRGVYAKVRGYQAESARGVSGILGPGKPYLVFVGSLMDWAEDHPTAERTRPAMWDLIRECPDVHFQMLTKRAERIEELLPDDWGDGYPNVWMGTSIENNEYTWRADLLREIPAVVRFVSYEPALGPLAGSLDLEGIDWIIYGGESGPGHRREGVSTDPKVWARSMRKACRRAGVAFFHKQSSARWSETGVALDGAVVREFPTPRRGWRG